MLVSKMNSLFELMIRKLLSQGPVSEAIQMQSTRNWALTGGTPDALRNSSAAQKITDNFLDISSASFCQGNSPSTHEENHQYHYYHRTYYPAN